MSGDTLGPGEGEVGMAGDQAKGSSAASLKQEVKELEADGEKLAALSEAEFQKLSTQFEAVLQDHPYVEGDVKLRQHAARARDILNHATVNSGEVTGSAKLTKELFTAMNQVIDGLTEVQEAE